MAYTTINKPSEHFNTKLYTGNGSTQSITGVGFAPDLVWTKARNGANSHLWYDKVRGVHKYIRSDQTGAEGTATNTLTSFDSDGFTVGDGDNGNTSGANGVAWNWKANGAGSSNTDGSITSTVAANTTAGFSIVSFTGTGANGTVGHGLGVKPAMIIQKNLSISSAWSVWHKSFSGSQVIYLNETGGVGTNTSSWNSTVPTASVFSVGTGSYPNGSGNSQIYYVFAEKTGYSKFGSYTGNGNADGTFVYTGFKPAFVMVKKTSESGNSWVMLDTARSDVPNANVNDQRLYADHNSAEASSSTRAMDLVSNGFKIRGDGGDVNNNSQTYIYMAFASAPLVGTNGVTAKAR